LPHAFNFTAGLRLSDGEEENGSQGKAGKGKKE
jgi:hypothetical protein